VWSTVECIARSDEAISIGRPVANTQVYILDAAGQLAPIGVAGEICIGGDGVAVGYHNRPELTAERFIPDPYSDRPGARLYRTGDLGRWAPDGRLHHLGRADHQVKIRGFRIELGEIEQMINTHTAVRQCVVVVREAQVDDSRLVAYVIYDIGEELTASDMKRHLRAQLPDYMIPSIVVPMNELPLTPNGKLDRRALPDPFARGQRSDVQGNHLTTATEQAMAEIWKSVLKVPSVGPEDNFFELGGYSLLSLRVAKLVEKRTGRNMDPRALFFHSLRQVAAQIDADKSALSAS
jgi:acyl-CoA synthetase (AMP-forming)/AMP-acid ligase II